MTRKRVFIVLVWLAAAFLFEPGAVCSDTIEVDKDTGTVIYRGIFEKENTARAGVVFLRIEYKFPKEEGAEAESQARREYIVDYYFVARSGYSRFEMAVSDSRKNAFPKTRSVYFSEDKLCALEGTKIRFKMIKLVDNSITYQLVVPEGLKDKIKSQQPEDLVGK